MSDFTLVNLLTGSKELPVGCLSIISYLEEKAFKVDFRDYQFNKFKEPHSIENMASFAGKNSADIIGISCMVSNLPHAVLAAKELKEKYPEKIIIFGGPGPSEVANELIQSFPFIDVVVQGEGEQTIFELLTALKNEKNLKHVSGIVFRKGKKTYANPCRQRIVELDKLPLPAYHKINLKEYNKISIETSRGCPYNCAFCCINSLWNHQNCQKSLLRVLEEINLLTSEYNIKKIWFNDDTFVLSKKRVLGFCNLLKKEQLDLAWNCFGRINLMDSKLMAAMSESGCYGIFYGVESGSNNVLKAINKEFTIKKAKKVILKSKNYFDILCSFIYGFPFETLKDFHQSLLFWYLLEEKNIHLQIYLISPLKSTALYVKYKHLLEFSPALISWLTSTKMNEQTLELVKSYPEIFPSFYHFKSETLLQKHKLFKQFLAWKIHRQKNAGAN